jgi:cyclopropane-fatty-acyl-phospholipid synthase
VRLLEEAGFEVIGVQAMREHYVRTIRAWLDNFEHGQPARRYTLLAASVLWGVRLART